MRQNVRTNYTAKDLIKHLSSIGKISADTVNMYQLPGRAQTIGGVSYYLCDDAETSRLVETVFNPSTETEQNETE